MIFPILKKHWMRFQELTGMECVVCDGEYTRYAKERMVELGIPFVFGNENIYLPNLGVLLKKTHKTELPEIEKFSPFTQRLVLEAIYGDWTQKAGKEISEELGVSRITAY